MLPVSPQCGHPARAEKQCEHLVGCPTGQILRELAAGDSFNLYTFPQRFKKVQGSVNRSFPSESFLEQQFRFSTVLVRPGLGGKRK